MGGVAPKILVVLAAVIVLIIIALAVDKAYIGYELGEAAKNGCCCGGAAQPGKYYAAPPSQQCAAGYTHAAGLCSSQSCGL